MVDTVFSVLVTYLTINAVTGFAVFGCAEVMTYINPKKFSDTRDGLETMYKKPFTNILIIMTLFIPLLLTVIMENRSKK